MYTLIEIHTIVKGKVSIEIIQFILPYGIYMYP